MLHFYSTRFSEFSSNINNDLPLFLNLWWPPPQNTAVQPDLLEAPTYSSEESASRILPLLPEFCQTLIFLGHGCDLVSISMMLRDLLQPVSPSGDRHPLKGFLQDTHHQGEFLFCPLIVMRGLKSTFNEKELVASQQRNRPIVHMTLVLMGLDPSPLLDHFFYLNPWNRSWLL